MNAFRILLDLEMGSGRGSSPAPKASIPLALAALSIVINGFHKLTGNVSDFKEVKPGRGSDVLVNSFRWGGGREGGLLEEVTLELRLGEPGSRPKEVGGNTLQV